MAIENTPVTLKPEHITAIFGVDSSWFLPLKTACDEANINTVLRLSAFFGNISVESGNLSRLSENLNYSASRLMSVFPSKFPDQATANAYAGNPEKIANRVYANKIGNGSEASGDGWKFRGRGLIQLTGRSNYAQCTRGGVPCLDNSDYLMTKEGAAKSAAWYFSNRGCNELADRNLFAQLVKRINAAGLDMDKRVAMYKKSIQVLTGQIDVSDIQPSNTSDPEDNPTPNARHGAVVEPASPAAPQYPYNAVFESRSGHVIEIDDTPDHERLHWYHRTGTYMEMQPDGSFVVKTKKDRYELVDGDYSMSVAGDRTETISGQSYEKAGSKVISSGGDITFEASNNIQMNSATVSVRNVLQAQQIEVQMITMSPGGAGLGDVAQLRAREAVHADTASALDPGSPGGSAISGVANSMSFGDSGNPSFTKPVTHQQPVVMPAYSPGQLPAPAANGSALYKASPSSPPKPIYSDGQKWYDSQGAQVS